MDPTAGLSSGERKKARRRERKAAERAAGRDLEALTSEAVELALALAPEVAAAPDAVAGDRPLDVAVPTIDAARFVRKRINEALAFGEWLDEVEVWVWEAGVSTRPALTDAGRDRGVELRLAQVQRNKGGPS